MDNQNSLHSQWPSLSNPYLISDNVTFPTTTVVPSSFSPPAGTPWSTMVSGPYTTQGLYSAGNPGFVVAEESIKKEKSPSKFRSIDDPWEAEN